MGVTGTYTGLDTSDATADSTDIRADKTAYVNGILITGTIPIQGDQNGDEGSHIINLPNGIYEGKTATASDFDLVPLNIRNGVSIFGVNGISYGKCRILKKEYFHDS